VRSKRKRGGKTSLDWEVNALAYGASYALALGTGQFIVLAGNVPASAVAGGQSLPGKIHVHSVEVDVSVFNPAGAAVAAYSFAVGVHLSRWSSVSIATVAQWSTQSPFTVPDANEPWYFLDRRVVTLTPNAMTTSPWRQTIKATVPINKTVGQGESIGVLLANSAGSPNTLSFLSYCRASITRMW